MRSIKIYKIAAVWLLTVLAAGNGKTTQPERLLQRYIEEEMYIVGNYPKVGEIFEVVYRIRIRESVDWTLRKSYLTKDYCAVIHAQSEATEMIGESKFFFSNLSVGESKEFRARCRILKPWNWIQVTGHIALASQGKTRGIVAAKGGIPLYLIDPETGQYGTKEQWLNRGIGVLGKYNNVEPQWFSEIDPAWAESNRKIVQEMRQFEPVLTDSEALCLHQDNYLLIINAIGDSNATDDERIKYLLKAGWLEAQRAGENAKQQWFQEFMDENKGKWGGNPNLNFFRDNNSFDSDYLGSNNLPKDRITTTFVGQ